MEGMTLEQAKAIIAGLNERAWKAAPIGDVKVGTPLIVRNSSRFHSEKAFFIKAVVRVTAAQIVVGDYKFWKKDGRKVGGGSFDIVVIPTVDEIYAISIVNDEVDRQIALRNFARRIGDKYKTLPLELIERFKAAAEAGGYEV